MSYQEMNRKLLFSKVLLIICLIAPFGHIRSIPVIEDLNSSKAAIKNESFEINNIQFEHVDLGGVLSNSAIYSVLQDHLGFMWFGTQIGLVKYDGYEITVYRNDSQNPESLSDDSVYALHEDAAGNLWIGTRSGGLNLFDRNREVFKVYRHQEDDPNSLSHDQVYTIFGDSDGILWIGTRNGLDRFDHKKGVFTTFQHNEDDANSISSNVVHAIIQTQAGSLWVGAGSELNYFDIKNESFKHISRQLQNHENQADNTILSLSSGDQNMLWIGREEGIELFNIEAGKFSKKLKLSGDSSDSQAISIITIYQDRHDILWIGTLNHGIFLADGQTGTVTQYRHKPDDSDSLSDDMVFSIYQDAAGNYWICTLSGVNYFDPNARKFHTYLTPDGNEDEADNSTINAIAHDKENGLWIGTTNSGLEYLNRETKEVTQYRFIPEDSQSIQSDKIWSLLVDKDGVLWVGTGGGGLSRFNKTSKTFTNYRHDPQNPGSLIDNNITRILQDRTGALWLATNNGLDRFDAAEEIFTHYQHQPGRPGSLSEYRAVALCEDHQGILWIGTWGEGLYALDLSTVEKTSPEDTFFTNYRNQANNPDSLSSNNVFTIHEDVNGTLWVGTQSGLNRFHRESGVFTVYNKQDGLPSNIIVGILEDPHPPGSSQGSHLWLSTEGLSRFDTGKVEFTNYDVQDGLASNSSALGAYYRNERGEMFFGTTSGITYFHPHNIIDNAYIPPVVLTNFQIYNEPVPIGDNSPLDAHINVKSSLELDYTDSVITFEYAALNYTNPEKNQYSYKLEGLDKDWNNVGTRRFATYTTLPPGTYTFRVRGSNNDGVWNTEGLSLKIVVNPPWWKTWWAYSIYGMIIVGMIFGYNYYRMKEKNRRVAQLEAEVSERTIYLQSTNRQLQTEIKERWRAEQELQTLNQELENRVNERTLRVRQLAARLAETEEIERQKIAAELHDQISQNLVALSVSLEILRGELQPPAENIQSNSNPLKYIGNMHQIVQQTSQRIRGLMEDLRPPALEEYGLLAALRWNSSQLSLANQIQIDVTGNQILPRPSPAVETALFRIAQEATINAIHHSNAATIQIKLQDAPHQIRLIICDDGIGFDLQNPPLSKERKHWGLQIMTERAESVGGSFLIETAPGKGVTITVEVKK